MTTIHRRARISTPHIERRPLYQQRAGTAAIWLICLAPILVLPNAYMRWGWPTLLAIVISAGVALWGAPAGRLPAWVWGAGAVFGVVFVVSALAGDAPLAQVMGRMPRYEGLVTLPVLVAAVWVGARTSGPGADRSAARTTATALSVSSVALGIVALAEAMGLRPIETDLARPGALAGNATDQGILGAIFFAVLGMIVLGEWSRAARLPRLALLGAIAGALSAILSASRAGVLALGAAGIALGVIAVIRSQRRRRAAVVAAVGLAGLVGVVLSVPATRLRLLGLTDFAAQTIGDRVIIWSDALTVFAANPWLGVGPNGYMDAAPAVFSDGWYERARVGAVLDSPHNLVLQVLVTTGIIGACLFVAFAVAVLFAGVRSIRRAVALPAVRDLQVGALIAIPAGGLALLTHVTSPKTLALLALMTGWLVAVPVTKAMSRNARVVLSLLMAVWFGALSTWTVADAAILSAVRAGSDITAMEENFTLAQQLRPWDVDIALVATQTFGTAASAGIAEARDPAVRWSTRAVSQLPSSIRALQDAGTIALASGDVDRAVSLLGRAATLSPADPRVAHDLGVSLYASGNLAGARRSLERALELAPGSEQTRRFLDEVVSVGSG